MRYPVDPALSRVTEHYRSPAEAKATGLRYHGGIDIAPKVRGTLLPCYAVESGHIVIADRTLEKGDASGYDVMILTPSGVRWWYGHLSSVAVWPGQRVEEGDRIGNIGSTGYSTGVHLHLERHYPRIDMETDPWPYISKASTTKASLPDSTEEEDDMYTDKDRARDDLTHAAVARIENHAVQIRAALNRIETDGAVVRWATTDEAVGLRRMTADLSNALRALPQLTSLSVVTLAEGEAERIAEATADEQHRRSAA